MTPFPPMTTSDFKETLRPQADIVCIVATTSS